jgi:hypothetical protein
MPGDYSTRFGSRLCPASPGEDATTARFFLCAGCRVQVFVCRRCDRGQIYCAGTCAQDARQQSQRAAGRRYQETHRGRMKHAARASRHRARQKIVTHQGSPPPSWNDVVPPDAVPFDAAVTASKPAATHDVVMRSQGSSPGFCRCHWCGERCSPLLRNEFLRRRQRGSSRDRKRRKLYDHPS